MSAHFAFIPCERGYTLPVGGGRTPFNQPFSGYYRIACNEECAVELASGNRSGVVWNLSALGLYLVLQPPLPAVGEELGVRFTLTGDPSPLVAHCRVVWSNAPLARGVGQTAMALPPGCGLEFLAIGADDRERISARVRAAHPVQHRTQAADALAASQAARIEAAVLQAIAALGVREWEFTVADHLQNGRVMIEIRSPEGALAYTSVGVDDCPNAIAQRLRMFVGR